MTWRAGMTRNIQVAAKSMSVIVWKQNELACTHVDRITAGDSKPHLARSDKMRSNDMARRNLKGLAIARRELPADTPGRGEFCLEEDSSGQPNHAQNI